MGARRVEIVADCNACSFPSATRAKAMICWICVRAKSRSIEVKMTSSDRLYFWTSLSSCASSAISTLALKQQIPVNLRAASLKCQGEEDVVH